MEVREAKGTGVQMKGIEAPTNGHTHTAALSNTDGFMEHSDEITPMLTATAHSGYITSMEEYHQAAAART